MLTLSVDKGDLEVLLAALKGYVGKATPGTPETRRAEFLLYTVDYRLRWLTARTTVCPHCNKDTEQPKGELNDASE